MKTFTIEHKHAKTIMHINGFDIFDASKKNNINLNAWQVIK